jgi:hypothetical protein
MSPAGLKGVAEEAGRELVVVCGENMGDIFRRNAFNLGLTWFRARRPSPTRATETRFVRPRDAPADQRDAGEDVHADSAVSQGGGDPLERRHLRRSAAASSPNPWRDGPRSVGPTPRRRVA